jgi:hypothetical protein
MATDRYMDVDVFATDEPEVEPYFPGTDPDGKERLPPFAGRFAAKDMAMTDVEDPRPKPKTEPGAVARSPFVR